MKIKAASIILFLGLTLLQIQGAQAGGKKKKVTPGQVDQTVVIKNNPYASTNYKKIVLLPDQRVFIHEPRFSNPYGGGEPLGIYRQESDENGVCKLFGLDSMLHWRGEEDKSGSLAVINYKGQFAEISNEPKNRFRGFTCTSDSSPGIVPQEEKRFGNDDKGVSIYLPPA